MRQLRLAASVVAVATLAACGGGKPAIDRQPPASVIRTVAGTGPLSGDGGGQPAASLAARGNPLLHGRTLYVSSNGPTGDELHAIDLDRGVVADPRFDRLEDRWRPLDIYRDILYMADDYRIYAVDLRKGAVRAVAGTGDPETGGGDGPALSARVAHVNDLVGADDALYLVDDTRALRRVDLATGRIETLAVPEGDVTANFGPLGLGDGVVYIRQERRVTAFDLASHRMSVVAGNGQVPGPQGEVVEDGPAREIVLAPRSLAVAGRTLYLTDVDWSGRVRLRALDLDSGVLRTLAGRAGQGERAPAPLPGSPPQPMAGVRVPEGPLHWAGGLLYAGGYQVLAYDLAAGTVTTVTASAEPSSAGDGGPATLARLGTAVASATDGTRLWITDVSEDRRASIREVDLGTGLIRTLVQGVGGRSLTYAGGTLYVAGGGKVHAVDVATGQARTVAGRGGEPQPEQEADPSRNGDGGPAADALIGPASTALVGRKLYVGAHTVRVVDLVTGVISTVPGLGAAASCFHSRASSPGYFVVAAGAGSLFVADSCGHRVRGIDLASGTVRPVAGTGEPPVSERPREDGDGGPAVRARLWNPDGLAVHGDRLLIADTDNQRIRVVDLTTGLIHTLAGTGQHGFGGDLGAPSAATLAAPRGVSVGPDGRVWIADTGNHRIRVVGPRVPASARP